MANAIEEEARRTVGKKQLAMEAFARALRQLPTIIADNAGLDSAEIVRARVLRPRSHTLFVPMVSTHTRAHPGTACAARRLARARAPCVPRASLLVGWCWWVQVANLRTLHYEGHHSAGIDIRTGSTGDMKTLGIMEPLKVRGWEWG
jgi:chaperonin GroEL (HSP60 family)